MKVRKAENGIDRFALQASGDFMLVTHWVIQPQLIGIASQQLRIKVIAITLDCPECLCLDRCLCRVVFAHSIAPM